MNERPFPRDILIQSWPYGQPSVTEVVDAQLKGLEDAGYAIVRRKREGES
jgi:hypothetical protein